MKVTKEIASPGVAKLAANEEDQGWITPKSSCSPNKEKNGLKYGEVSILSNAYSVLSSQEELGEDTKDSAEEKDHVEVDLNEDHSHVIDPLVESTEIVGTSNKSITYNYKFIQKFSIILLIKHMYI